MKTSLQTFNDMRPRQLETIRLERQFGGFLPVLQFVGGETEASSRVFLTAGDALKAANKWIGVPAHNIKWWTE